MAGKTLTQLMRAKVIETEHTAPRITGEFNVAVPVPGGFRIERRSNMDDSWIEDYDPERWGVIGPAGIIHVPDLGLRREAAARVAMRYRSRRAAIT